MSDSKLNTLGGYKNELVDAFQECAFSLREIAEKLSDSQIFDEYIKNIFFSLDYDHLDLSLCTRYLVQEIVCSLKRNADREEIKSEVWDRFLEVLVDLGGKARTLSSKLNGAEALPLDISKENKINGSLLKKNDISLLMEVMSKYAYKWEELCVALSFPKNAIEECRQGSSFVIKIHRVLLSWIVDKISQEPPTLLNLQLFLQGPLLNCANASTELYNKFYDKKNKRMELLESSGSSIGGLLHPSEDVKFGSSTLLEVQVDSSQPVSYEWLKDGVKLYSDPNCIGADHSILCVKKVTKSEKYSCSVCIGNETFITNTAKLSDIPPPKDQYLVDKYSKFEEVPEDSWPPVSTGAFIKLAIIVGQKKSWMDTIEHDLDEILVTKDLIDYTEIFGTYDSGVVLVEGRPGSGKTTLVSKITRDWANTHRILRGASKVYFILLRMLNTTNHENLFDILRPLYVDDEDTREALKDIKKCNGKGVCFVLDGLDEYKRNNKQGIIHDIIKQNILPHAMVIVASRPVGTVHYREKHGVTKRIEVLGFTKENVYNYVNNYPFDHSQTASDLTKYLKKYINVLHMCYLPVHASMVCYMYITLGDNIPTTETLLYDHFTCMTVVRKMKKEDELYSVLKTLNSLTGEIKEHFVTICKLAFQMVQRSVQVLSKSDFSAQLDHKSGSDDQFLGLVVVDSVAELLGYKEMYSFLHLTYQEFLAAWYISKLDWRDQYLVIKELCQNKFYQILKFYFGLVDINKCTYQLVEVIKSYPLVHCLQCAFESHNENACSILENYIYNNEKILSLHDCSIMPLDFTAMGYFMTNCSSHFSRIHIIRCYFNIEGVEAFLSAVSAYELCFIKHLKIIFLMNPDQAINMLLNSVCYLEHLDLGTTVFYDEDIRTVTNNVILSQLRVLKMCVYIKERGVAELLKFGSQKFCQLEACSQFYSRTFTDNSTITDFTWNYLCHSFKKQVVPFGEFYSRELVLCCLRFNQIQFVNFLHCISFCFVDCCIDDGAIATIVTCLTRRQRVTNLRSLIFDLNDITLMGALFLGYLLTMSPDIENFSVLGNNIDSIGAEAIAVSLEKCKRLARCDVQLNNIEDYGAIAIAKATAHFPHLKLYLWNHNITQYGIAEVLKCKKGNSINSIHFSHAQYLQIYPQLFDKLLKNCYTVSKFKVTDTLGFSPYQLITNSEDLIPKVLTELKCFKNLVHLNMERCHIGSSQAMNLVKALKYMPQLRILNLCLNNLCSPGTIAIAGGLKFCPQLEVLDISANAFSSPDSISALAEGLKHVPGLKELVLSDNRLFSMAGDIIAIEFPKLCKLNLACCEVDSHGATSLAKHINNCLSLRDLNLNGNDLGSGLVGIANSLKYCNLQILSLNSVRICGDAARALSSTFEYCINLEELYLRESHMDPTATEYIVDGFKFCKKLRKLDCSYNKVTPRAAARLSRCLQHGNIEKLWLSGCGIDDRGCITLAVGLHYCSHLELLHLDKNEIGSEGTKALANEMKSLTSMNLYMNHNPINEDSAIHLVKELKETCVNLTDTGFSEEIRKKIQEINRKKKVPFKF